MGLVVASPRLRNCASYLRAIIRAVLKQPRLSEVYRNGSGLRLASKPAFASKYKALPEKSHFAALLDGFLMALWTR